jgi:hypothetical protein
MKQTKTTISIVLLLWLCLPLFSLGQGGLTRVKIHAPKDKDRIAEVLGLLNIDHFVTDRDGGIVAEISKSDVPKLQQLHYPYDVLVPDVGRQLDSLNKIYYRSLQNTNNDPKSRVAFEQPGSTSGSIIVQPAAFQVKSTFGGYYSYPEMIAAMDALVASYPAIAKKINLGTTTDGNTLWMIKISDNVASDEPSEPEVLYMGLQHAREAITGASMIFFMQYLCERYALDTRIKNLVDNREIYIIPCFNPDGWEYNRTSESGKPGGDWRKNRKVTGTTTFGIDLNRNWGIDWGNCNAPISGPASSCGTTDKTQDTYWGTGAFSEVETAAVRDFAETHHLVAGFDQHAYGPYYSLPFGRHSLHTMGQKAKDFYTAIPALMGTYNGMRAADSYDALGYEVAGGFKDWMLMGDLGTGTKDTVWALTGEGAAGGGGTDANIIANGTQSFWAPASQIVNLSKSMCYQNLQLLYAAGTYVDIQDNSSIALSPAATKMKFSVKRLGIGNDPVTITLVPIENIKVTGAPITISNMLYYTAYADSIAYTIPASFNTTGGRIKFAWKVSMAGYTYSDTVVKFAKPTILFTDDMEGTLTTNWTNTGAAGASGFGYNYVAGNWLFTASGGYNSTKALSESAAGTNYTTKTNSIVQCNTTFNLSGSTAAYLTFMARYRAENHRDKVQVQVLLNGTTWTPIAGTTTIQEPGTLDDATLNGQPALTGIHDFWTSEMFDLSPYVAQTALKIRFVFTSDDDPSTFKYELDDGFYIDNVQVMKTSASLVVLPVKFLDFTAELQPDVTVKLDWTASVDQQHDYFMVERSADGANFTGIGMGPRVAPYEFIDANPFNGRNFYRIRQVDKDGTITYSKIVSVTVRKNHIVSIFPNPATDALVIRMNNTSSETLQVELTDVQGRVIYRKAHTADQVNADIRIDLRGFDPQVYILKISNDKGELMTTEKIVKL